MIISLRDKVWDRALKRLRERQKNADLVRSYLDNDYELVKKLQFEAIDDYLNEAPELRKLREAAHKESLASERRRANVSRKWPRRSALSKYT